LIVFCFVHIYFKILLQFRYKKIQESKDLSTKSSADLTAVLGTSVSTASFANSIVSSTSTQSFASSMNNFVEDNKEYPTDIKKKDKQKNRDKKKKSKVVDEI